MRMAPREGASDGSKDLRRTGRDERATDVALFAARRAAASRGRRLARFERAALPGKRGKLVVVRCVAARARPLYGRLSCGAQGRCRHLQCVPHLRHTGGGGGPWGGLFQAIYGGRGGGL